MQANDSKFSHIAADRRARRCCRAGCGVRWIVRRLEQANRTRSPSRAVEQGKQIFRFDTFGDERQWTDVLRMHEVISAAVDPTTALSVGLKVDAEALPQSVVDGIQDGSIDLKSPGNDRRSAETECRRWR